MRLMFKSKCGETPSGGTFLMKTILRLALGSVLAGGTFASAAPTELLVKFKPNASPALLNASIGARVVKNLPEIGWQKIQLPSSVSKDRGLRYYKALTTVAAVESSIKYTKDRTPNDPLIGQTTGTNYKQYWHEQIKMFGAWELSIGSPSVLLAVVDSGIRATHEDLAAQHSPLSRNFTTGGSPTDLTDGDGHGTHVAGCAAATGNNSKGGAGTAWNVKILTCKITYGESGTEDFAEAVIYAANQGAKVINMSFGSYGASSMLNDAVQFAYLKDAVLVSSAGNDNIPNPHYPSDFPNVISVGSTNQGGGKSDFSNFGTGVDVAAPGGDIVSTGISADSAYIVNSGTSMASPITAGAIALMRAYAPELSNNEFVSAIYNTAVQGTDRFTVRGQIDVNAAILSLPVGVKTEVDPSTAAVVSNEGTIVNPTGSPTTDSSYLASADNSALEVRSNYRAGIGTVASVATTLKVTPTADKLLTGRLNMSLRAASGVTMLVMIQNASTNQFELFHSAKLSTATTNVDLPLPRPTLLKYRKSDGSVNIMVRTINPSRLSPGGTSFRTSFDSIGLSVTSRK